VACAALLALVAWTPPAARAGVLGRLHLQGSVEFADFHFADLARWTRTVPDFPTDSGQEWRLDLEDVGTTGFRVGLLLDDRAELTWSRFLAHTRYRAYIDGQEVTPDLEGPALFLPESVDMRFDAVSFGMRLTELRVRASRWLTVDPVARLGYGWVLTSQSGPIALGLLPEQNFSDSDKMVELSAGLVVRAGPAEILGTSVGPIEVGGELRSFHFRWDAEDPNDYFPARTTYAIAWTARVGLVF
jgi:hypothetical protein